MFAEGFPYSCGPPLCCARCSSGAPGPEPASAARSIIRIALCARSAAARRSASAPCSTWGATSRSSGGTGRCCAAGSSSCSTARPSWFRCPVRRRSERHAQRIAAQLLNSAPSGGTGRPDLQTVDVGSLELIRPRSVGVEHVGLWAMERLGLEALLERLGFNGTQRALAMATVIARMAAPGSERASWRWLCERSALGELLGVDFERMSMMRLYRRLRCPDGAARGDRGAAVRSGDGSVRAALHGDALRPDQHLLRGRSGGPAQGRTRPFQGEARRLPALDPGAGARRLGLRAPLRGVLRRGQRRQDPGVDARGPGRAVGRAGGDGRGDRHRGQHRLAARERLPLSGGQPGTHPPLRSRSGAGHRDPVAPDGPCAQGGRRRRWRGAALLLLRGAGRRRNRASQTASPRASRAR